ncbi:MAG: CRISPR-associated endonuclease Cas2 [Gammaproteobacteria bacterium]|nr:CRISPR-associated endonuclease Cas2 [Gammaproteobacteria bacterium]
MAHYLVCYDIADPRRLGRVHRRMVKHAVFIQLSVYYLKGDKKDLNNLLDELQHLMDERYDDIRAYQVKPLSEALQIGCAWLPDGLNLFN